MKGKGAGSGLHLFDLIFSLYIYFINSELPFGHSFRLYFARLVMGLPGKSPKWGLDRFSGERPFPAFSGGGWVLPGRDGGEPRLHTDACLLNTRTRFTWQAVQ
jgi:hypothetical protein